MEDRKNLFVVVFILFFVMIYVQVMFPTPAPVTSTTENSTAVTAPQSGQQVAQTSVTPIAAQGVNTFHSGTVPSLAQLDESPQSFVNTGAALIAINHLGGRIQGISLKQYTENVGTTDPLQLVAKLDGAPLPLGVIADGANDDFVLYQLDQTSVPPMEGQYYVTKHDAPAVLTFTGTLPSGLQVTKKLTFTYGSYSFKTDISFNRATGGNVPMVLQWTHPANSDTVSSEGVARTFSYLTAENKLTSTPFSSQKDPRTTTPLARWIAICNYYFIEALINPNNPTAVAQGKTGDTFFVQATGDALGGSFLSYVGPKDMESLKAVGFSLERSVDLGMFSVLAHPILALMKFFYSFIGNYGLSIILLTLLIKLGFLPLTQSSFKSMQAMQELQPEIAALRERVTDPNILNQELMTLYKKRGVNPLGGCFPMLIQIPVFLGLYNALLNSIDLRHEKFALWINDLSAPESLKLFGIGIPLMILLMGASMLIQQLTQPSTMDPQQKKIMMFMPVIFTGMFILHPMPSALVLYWLTNNLISIVQQYSIRENRRISPLQATAYASLIIFSFGFILTKL
jgi:YidC/Oxa1 family membrane protein insertase